MGGVRPSWPVQAAAPRCCAARSPGTVVFQFQADDQGGCGSGRPAGRPWRPMQRHCRRRTPPRAGGRVSQSPSWTVAGIAPRWPGGRTSPRTRSRHAPRRCRRRRSSPRPESDRTTSRAGDRRSRQPSRVRLREKSPDSRRESRRSSPPRSYYNQEVAEWRQRRCRLANFARMRDHHLLPPVASPRCCSPSSWR